MRVVLVPLAGIVLSGAVAMTHAGTEPGFFPPGGKEQPLAPAKKRSVYEMPVAVEEVSEPEVKVDAAPGEAVEASVAEKPAATDGLFVEFAPDPVSRATETMGALLESGLQQARVQRLPMAIMPFVERPRAHKDNALGERISESFIFQLQKRGFNLVDYRAVSMTTTVKPELSAKQLTGLRNRFRIYFVLTGTYARYPDGIVINARVLDTTTRQVVASGQGHITNDELEGQLPGYDPLTVMRKGLIIENGDGPVGWQ